MFLYHATVRHNLPSILKKGLTRGNPQNFEGMYMDDCVYLSFSPEIGISFIENSDSYDGEEDIVVFRIDSRKLDKGFIGYDWNVLCEYEREIVSLTYYKDIAPSDLHLMNEHEIEETKEVTFPDLRYLDEDSREIWEIIGNIFDEEVETNMEEEKG